MHQLDSDPSRGTVFHVLRCLNPQALEKNERERDGSERFRTRERQMKDSRTDSHPIFSFSLELPTEA
ncbi:MAG: hypothetical protein AAF938_12765, partial [Myxococcota bacterium]